MIHNQHMTEDELKDLPTNLNLSSFPNITDLVQRGYEKGQNNAMLSHGEGGSDNIYGPNSVTSSLGRGGEAHDNTPSTPLSAGDRLNYLNQQSDAQSAGDKSEDEDHDALINMLKGYAHGG